MLVIAGLLAIQHVIRLKTCLRSPHGPCDPKRMPDLRSEISALAASFADAVLAAIRGASLEELLAENGGAPRRGPGRPRGRAMKATPTAPRPSAPRAKAAGGRLARRSPADIEKALGLVVSTLKATKGKGLRSEEIQKSLNLDKRELPRVLKTGLAKKVLRSKGQKRARQYFAS